MQQRQLDELSIGGSGTSQVSFSQVITRLQDQEGVRLIEQRLRPLKHYPDPLPPPLHWPSLTTEQLPQLHSPTAEQVAQLHGLTTQQLAQLHDVVHNQDQDEDVAENEGAAAGSQRARDGARPRVSAPGTAPGTAAGSSSIAGSTYDKAEALQREVANYPEAQKWLTQYVSMGKVKVIDVHEVCWMKA